MNKTAPLLVAACAVFACIITVTATCLPMTPLYTVRMEQVSTKMGFLPTAMNEFTYTTEKGYTLNNDTPYIFSSVTIAITCDTSLETCFFTCDTCLETCPESCEPTCGTETCPESCEPTCGTETCPETCEPTCVEETCNHQPTCETSCPVTCWNTCHGNTCWISCCGFTCEPTCDETTPNTCPGTCNTCLCNT